MDFGPSCPQIPLNATVNPNVFTANGGGQTEFFPTEPFSEDCLTLNVWAPDQQSEMLPVIVWFFGGAFVQGGADSLYFNAAPAHIVVSVNFRSNIFGFPNAAGLADQNLGLLDQRAALEWVRDNIGAFGGDAGKIVAWGESAGSIALDYLNFAFPEDPIVQGVIMASGTALFPAKFTQSSDTAQANFAQVAVQLGCGTADAAAQIDCLRNVSWESIETLLAANVSLVFRPIPDERVVFADYPARYAAGAIARVPALIGTNQHELNALGSPPGVPFNQSNLDASANSAFLCLAATTATLRQAQGLTTYRFRYDGDFLDISPPAFPGAYHAAELPLIFGTTGQFHGVATAYEEEVSGKMQDLWLDFARDPERGLVAAGWDTFGAGKAVFLGDPDAPVKQVDIEEVDGVCPSS
ncbi:Alpha/Beta hydrolase protein [Mycena vulgaris]|nr:Alpha/Beta hydrolase protein [Mycena vulgaris]